jgi:hypothetical protein
MRERTKVKAYHGLMSSDDEDEPPTIKLDMVEYNYLRSERAKYKLVIQNWAETFRMQFKRNPTDEDTAKIPVEMKDWQDAEMKFLDFTVKMIDANLLPFNAEALFSAGSQTEAQENFQRKATMLMSRTGFNKTSTESDVM